MGRRTASQRAPHRAPHRTSVATLVVLAALSAALSTGCSAAAEQGDRRPSVTAAFYPYAFVAERVAGRYADVGNLTTPGIEPHDLELTPRQVADISEADLVVFQSDVQPAVDEAVAQNSTGEALDVAVVVAESHPGDLRPGDPHLWLDPVLLVPVADAVADELASADPAHAAAYRRNADALADDLTELDADFRAGLARCRRTDFVTSHAAFGYLADRYGLTMVPIAGLSPDAEPSPEHLVEIADRIRATGVSTVFSERLGSKRYADTLAAELGVKAAVLDPVEGLTDEDSSETYLTLMRDNLAALRTANGCS